MLYHLYPQKMQSKTKKLSIRWVSSIITGALIIAGCEVVLPQPKDPEADSGLASQGQTQIVENVVKHISLFKQGVSFDILDNNQSRDATWVLAKGDITQVYTDTLAIEKKSESQSIENFLAAINKKAPKGCSYIIKTKNGLDNYKIHELILPSSCKQWWWTSELIYIYNSENPDKVIKIEQANKYAGPRSDKAKTKSRFESIQFL